MSAMELLPKIRHSPKPCRFGASVAIHMNMDKCYNAVCAGAYRAEVVHCVCSMSGCVGFSLTLSAFPLKLICGVTFATVCTRVYVCVCVCVCVCLRSTYQHASCMGIGDNDEVIWDSAFMMWRFLSCSFSPNSLHPLLSRTHLSVAFTGTGRLQVLRLSRTCDCFPVIRQCREWRRVSLRSACSLQDIWVFEPQLHGHHPRPSQSARFFVCRIAQDVYGMSLSRSLQDCSAARYGDGL